MLDLVLLSVVLNASLASWTEKMNVVEMRV